MITIIAISITTVLTCILFYLWTKRSYPDAVRVIQILGMGVVILIVANGVRILLEACWAGTLS